MSYGGRVAARRPRTEVSPPDRQGLRQLVAESTSGSSTHKTAGGVEVAAAAATPIWHAPSRMIPVAGDNGEMTGFESWSNAPDEFGVPANMFGHVPDHFYELIGRVVAVAAVVELKLDALDRALDPVRSKSYHAMELVKRCRKRLNDESYENVRHEGAALLDRACGAIRRRNDVVHSIWPNPRPESMFGWRVSVGNRDATGPETVEITVCEAWFHDLIVDLVGLVNDFNKFRNRLPQAR